MTKKMRMMGIPNSSWPQKASAIIHPVTSSSNLTK
jgi:hypothetical protein